ncbi:MAG: hypothetical protein R2727_02210 [Bacteroidales bacterium]
MSVAFAIRVANLPLYPAFVHPAGEGCFGSQLNSDQLPSMVTRYDAMPLNSSLINIFNSELLFTVDFSEKFRGLRTGGTVSIETA